MIVKKLALVVALGLLPLRSADAVTFTAEDGYFQHYTNVTTMGDLLSGTLTTSDNAQQSAVLDLVFSVVTNVFPGQIHARVTLSPIDEIIRAGEEFPFPTGGVAHIIGAPQISFTGWGSCRSGLLQLRTGERHIRVHRRCSKSELSVCGR